MIKKVLNIYRLSGMIGLYNTISSRLFLTKKAKCFPICKQVVSNGIGLEIGGLSGVFKRRGILPVYPIIASLDNCNYSDNTIWEGAISEGLTFKYDKQHKPGKQYISEASDLHEIPSSTYDFILSSHIIEHTANPLQALTEWMRVLKDKGFIILLVPHKDGTFDWKRPVTALEHLIEDFKSGTKEDDLTHLSEILKLHDLRKDPGAGSFKEFKARSEKNFENRCLHQHVFNTELVVQLLSYMKLQIHAIENVLPYHIIAIAEKV